MMPNHEMVFRRARASRLPSRLLIPPGVRDELL